MNPLKFVIQEDAPIGAKIKVIGVGGGGSNAVARMLNDGVAGVEFHAVNTDLQALNACAVPHKLAIGAKVTNGLGAGSDPAIGRQAALEETERIIEMLEGADVVFVTAGLGGGTGTGAAPVVASLAKELNALTVAVVTTPFGYEGSRRMKQAEKGLAELAGTVDTVITVPNERLLELVPKGTSFFEAFRLADDVVRQAVQGISDIIITPGLINRDFADIRAIMMGMGHAMMGAASARGENASVEAARKAINSPLMEAGGVKGARAILINITASSRLGLHDVSEACTLIRAAAANEDVQINFGVVLNEALEDEVRITVIATGFQRETAPEISRPSFSQRFPEREEVPTPQPVSFPEEPVYEPPIVAAVHASESHAEPITEPESAPRRQPEPAPQVGLNDLDTPAFLRRDRRLYQ